MVRGDVAVKSVSQSLADKDKVVIGSIDELQHSWRLKCDHAEAVINWMVDPSNHEITNWKHEHCATFTSQYKKSLCAFKLLKTIKNSPKQTV